MSFFYNLNDKLNAIREKPEVTHKQLNERDEGKPGKNFAKIAKDAGERYGSKEAGERVAGAVRNKLKAQGKLEEEGFPRIQAAIQKYTQQGVNKLAKLGREGASKAKMAATRKKYNQYDNEEVDEGQDFGPGTAGPNKNQAGPTSPNAVYGPSPDTKNYKTPNLDKRRERTDPIDKEMNDPFYSFRKYPGELDAAFDKDGQGQTKYVNRTAPGVINKIKDKLGYDMPDPAYGPRPDERERLLKRYPAPGKSVDEDFGSGPHGPRGNQAGPMGNDPDVFNYKTPNMDRNEANPQSLDKIMGKEFAARFSADLPQLRDTGGQNKYVDRTRPTVVNKIKDKLSYDMPDPAYGPKPDERERLAKRYPAQGKSVDEEMYNQGGVYKEIEVEPKRPQQKEKGMTRGTRPAPKGEFMGTIKGGVWTADPPKPGQKGVPAPSGDPEGVKEAGAPMTAKQKSFAKLAPPANKITFADKIAGAKKEVDEMLGDVAAEAMRNALSPKQKKIDMNKNGKLDANDFAMLRKGAKPEMDEERSKGTAFDMSTPRAAKPKVGSIERGHKHDIKHTATGRMVTRRVDDQGNSVGSETDDEGNRKEKRTKAGRPDGTGKKIGAKGPSGKSKLMTREGEVDIRDQGEYDQEGDMAKNDIKTIVRHAQALSKVLGDNDNLPEWVQSKLAKIEGMMISVDEYMQNQAGEDNEEAIAEKAVSKKQQRFMGMVHSAQKGEKPASKAVSKVAKTMKKSDAEDFAKTKHKGLPEKAKKKEVDENSEGGRLNTTVNTDGTSSTSSSTGRISATIDKGTVSVKPAKSGGMSYGKGIYDSFNRDLEQMIAESMTINMSDSTEGNRSLTVTATDDDAMKLAMILKSAGLGGHGDDMHSHGEEACDTCGMQDCGCGDVEQAIDENAPDWPTNTETSSNALQYAGGLNKPKTDVAGDGQTTIPNTAVHTQQEDALRRMMEMAGLAEAAKPDFLNLDKDRNKNEPMKDAAADKEEDTVEESIRRMMEIAGVKKKPMDEQKTEEGNLFTKGLEDNDVKIGDKIPGTNAIKKKDIDESIFALTNQWQAYKG